MENLFKISYLTIKQLGSFYDNSFKSIDAIVDGMCMRCGNKELKNNTCFNCEEFGILDTNSKLYYKDGRAEYKKYIKVENKLLFTDMQLQAAKFINKNIEDKKDGLIWAVCGAGKTEITFLGIETILQNGGTVCFAIPRIDILYEVAERLDEFFLNVDVVVLNSKEPKLQVGQIYVMTTNQVLKFKNAFDLIIVDEVDAFPYEYNDKYDYAVHSSKTSEGICIYLTSTPSQKMLDKKLDTFIINRRWHGHDLPVPKVKYMHLNLVKKNILPLQLIFAIKFYKRQQLWFVSNINTGSIIYNLVKKYSLKFTTVHANDPNRRNKIINFNNGEYDILITTTILERGVTFEDIDVYVLDASSNLYNIAALVQIAGRVGRKKDFQDGKVVFLHQGVTDIIDESIKQIKTMNKS